MLFEILRNHVGTHDLAFGKNLFFHHFVKIARAIVVEFEEDFVEQVAHTILGVALIKEFRQVTAVSVVQKVDHIACTFGIGFAEIVGNLHQTVGGATHCRKNYDFRFAVFRN